MVCGCCCMVDRLISNSSIIRCTCVISIVVNLMCMLLYVVDLQHSASDAIAKK